MDRLWYLGVGKMKMKRKTIGSILLIIAVIGAIALLSLSNNFSHTVSMVMVFGSAICYVTGYYLTRDPVSKFNRQYKDTHLAVDALKPFADIAREHEKGNGDIVITYTESGKRVSDNMTFDCNVAKRLVDKSNF
jgi:hypothetical protein